MELLINEEQYKFLCMERQALEQNFTVNHLTQLDYAYLRGAQALYATIYNAAKPSISCGSCVAAFLKPLYYQLTKYENVHLQRK